jgi:hypothetical protein
MKTHQSFSRKQQSTHTVKTHAVSSLLLLPKLNVSLLSATHDASVYYRRSLTRPLCIKQRELSTCSRHLLQIEILTFILCDVSINTALSVERLATDWTVQESNPGAGEIFRTRPDRSWGPTQPPIKSYRNPFPGLKRSSSGVDHPSPSSGEVKERVQLHLHCPSGYSQPVLGWALPLPLPTKIKLLPWCSVACLRT